jgi:hypothetical protein
MSINIVVDNKYVITSVVIGITAARAGFCRYPADALRLPGIVASVI